MNKTCQKRKWRVYVTLLQYYYVLLMFPHCICVYVFVSLMHPKEFSTVAGTVRPSILRRCCGSVRTSNQQPDKKKKKGEGALNRNTAVFFSAFLVLPSFCSIFEILSFICPPLPRSSSLLSSLPPPLSSVYEFPLLGTAARRRSF